ncbi:hypothetical protein D3C85_1502940 [compost metagenome]
MSWVSSENVSKPPASSARNRYKRSGCRRGCASRCARAGWARFTVFNSQNRVTSLEPNSAIWSARSRRRPDSALLLDCRAPSKRLPSPVRVSWVPRCSVGCTKCPSRLKPPMLLRDSRAIGHQV